MRSGNTYRAARKAAAKAADYQWRDAPRNSQGIKYSPEEEPTRRRGRSPSQAAVEAYWASLRRMSLLAKQRTVANG